MARANPSQNRSSYIVIAAVVLAAVLIVTLGALAPGPAEFTPFEEAMVGGIVTSEHLPLARAQAIVRQMRNYRSPTLTPEEQRYSDHRQAQIDQATRDLRAGVCANSGERC